MSSHSSCTRTGFSHARCGSIRPARAIPRSRPRPARRGPRPPRVSCATQQAIGSPTKRTLPCARGCCSESLKVGSVDGATMAFTSGMSSRTNTRPSAAGGLAHARDARVRDRERKNATSRCPGRIMSGTKRAAAVQVARVLLARHARADRPGRPCCSCLSLMAFPYGARCYLPQDCIGARATLVATVSLTATPGRIPRAFARRI